MKMAKAVVNLAIKHQVSLGQESSGHYVIRNPRTREVVAISLRPNGQSAIVMIKRYIAQPEHIRNWR